MSGTRAALLILTGWLLTGCVNNSVQVDFATDPGILRGNWLGVGENGTFLFDLSATYVDETHYSVDGTATFEDEEGASVSGTLYGFRTAYLSVGVAAERDVSGLHQWGDAASAVRVLRHARSARTRYLQRFCGLSRFFSVTDSVPFCPETSASTLNLRKK